MSTTTDQPIFHQTMDFDALMNEARKHITALAGKIWTDHNGSDPGITQLEVLSFCIADLSYRTSFGVDDILAGYKGGKSLAIDLPLADVALPNNPVSIKDLRKVLLDMAHPQYVAYLEEIEGLDDPSAITPVTTKLLLRNAFPIIAEDTEIPFFAVAQNKKDAFLSFQDDFLFQQIDVADTVVSVDDSTHTMAGDSDGKTALKESAPLAKGALTQAITIDNDFSDDIKTPNTIAPIDSLPGETYGTKTKYNYIDPITLNGLYSIQLEFEDDLTQSATYLKDLNQNYFEDTLTVGANQYDISVLLPYWDDIQWSLRNVDINSASLQYIEIKTNEDYFIAVDKLNYDDYFYEYYAELELENHFLNAFIKLKTNIKSSITINGITYDFSVNFLDWNELSNASKRNYGGLNPTADQIIKVSIDDTENVFDIQSNFTIQRDIKLLTRITFDPTANLPHFLSVFHALENVFKELFDEQVALETALHSYMKNRAAGSIYHQYLEKINTVFDHLYGKPNNIWSYLGNYRNLGEDFSKFTASRVQEIALFGKILVAPNYNVNEIVSEIYVQIDQFLNPLIRFKTLSEMVDKDYQFDQLFNGPLLTNGFIEDADLDNLARKSVVYTSDLIRIIMDVAGVEAVEDFSISSYIDNRLMGRNVINCLDLTNSEVYKPRFSFEKSALSICVDDKEEIQDHTSVKNWYDEKLRALRVEQIPSANYYDLSVPLGTDMEIEKYQSIQHDFPEVYGIGEYGLPIDATDERKATAKQLKAFLLPFEQILANYLKQVAHLPELFSYNRDITNTYAFQPLYEVPDVQPLFKDFVQSNDTWDVFKQDLDNGYQELLTEGGEEAFSSRRNRFLSHLLGRFGESFENYATQLFDQHKYLLNDFSQVGNYQTEKENELTRLIDNKISFAEDYEKVSAQRYKAFNTTIEQLTTQNNWQDDNIGAYKLRLCRLLGIDTIDNEFIFGTADNGADKEGMHVVEHILLRPRTEDSTFLALTNRTGNLGTFVYDADKDPYSFKITIVLPLNADRFKKEAFRKFTEELIQLETPAHIVIDFKWMSSSCGQNFEQHYSAWKKGIHKLKPYFFQNRATLTDEQQEELQTTYRVPNERLSVLGASILELQDQLVEALDSPCNLSLSLYDADDKGMIIENGNITFEQNTTDIHHIKVSEIGGTLTTYKFESNTWNAKQEFKPVTSTYFDVDEFIPSDPKGLTTNAGGVGNYRIVYTLDNRSVEQQVEVTKAIVPVHIYIGISSKENSQMLAFNTETDGVFRISNQQWESHFLQFFPAQSTDTEMFDPYGEVYISSGSILTPLLLGKSNRNIYLQEIYDTYGAGTYHITYELDGQTTFADIQLYVEASIHVFNVKQELTANDEGIISIPSTMRTINLKFLPGNGDLEVYALDNVNSNSLVANYNTVEALAINRDTDQTYQDGIKYQFTYKIDGATVSTILFFEKRDLEFPTIELIKNGIFIEGNDFKFTTNDFKIPYQIRLHPKDAVASLLEEKTGVIIDTFTVPSDQFVTEFSISGIYEENGQGPLLIENKNDAGTATMRIYIDPIFQTIDTYVKILQNDVEVVEPEINVETNTDKYVIQCEPAGGIRTISKKLEDDTQLLNSIEIGEDNKKEFLDIQALHSQYGTGTYVVKYEVNGAQQEAEFYLVDIATNATKTDTTLNIVNAQTKTPIQPVNGVYNLVYDYLNKELAYTISFNNYPGMLMLMDREEVEVKMEIESSHSFYAKDLPSDDYQCSYYANKNEVLFQLNIINLDPQFVLTNVQQKDTNIFTVDPIPNLSVGHIYIWKEDNKFVSRKKFPTLTLDFSKKESMALQLTMYLEGYQATYNIQTTAAELQKMVEGLS